VSSGIAAVAALALLCAALALLLWQRGARTQRDVSAQRYLDRRVAGASMSGAYRAGGLPGAGGMAGAAGAGSAGGRGQEGHVATLAASARSAPGATAAAAATAPGTQRASGAGAMPRGAERGLPERRRRLPPYIEHFLVRAGLSSAGAPALIVCAAWALGIVWTGLHAGATAAGAAAIASIAAAALVITARTQRRRLAIVVQLPTFLDGIVRLVTLGNSVPSAFQAALQTTEAPLRECLDHVSRMLRAGVEIDRALTHVAAVYRTREFEFVGAVLRLSVKYGGRADVMLERMSAFMRDLEQAERELAAMSAETRLSAWVLVALPLAIGGFLVATNPAYFSAMWGDVEGRRLVYLAFALQALGGYVLYRMTRLRA
jgi:tight adherence protein B